MEAKDTVMSREDIQGYIRAHKDEILSTPDAWKEEQMIASFQAEISFKAGIREGIRRAYEDMKVLHRIVDYDLDACVEHLEGIYGKPSSRNGE